MVVQQHILNWLYSVLTSEYHDVNRAYNDVAQALSQYPTLSPRTDVHTFPNGTSALLLHLSGTIPVLFRGTTYRFPVSLWVPHAYPREPPLIYVTPTENMLVRPGQHVDPQGQVYHPYLAGWPTFWDKSSILDFLAILRDIFAKEPPVISKQQIRPPAQPQHQQPHTPTPPPVPPLPPELSARPARTASPVRPIPSAPQPPPPPPKPTPPERQEQASPAQPQAPAAPPRPPLPPELARPTSQPPQPRYDATPGLPPTYSPGPAAAASHHAVAPGHPQHHGARPPSMYQSEPSQHQQWQPQQHFQQPLERQQPPSHFPPPGGIPQPAPPAQAQAQAYGAPPPPGWHPQQPPQPVQPQPQPKPPPPPDLMDEPLTLEIPSSSSSVSAPPIPPNPEKDALLHQLAATLQSLRHRSRAQNETSLQGLQAQRTAMLSAASTLQAELAELSQLSSLLASNGSILQSSLRQADGVIEASATQSAPGIDELLVAPTVVANQLYDLVAEERALGDAIFVVGRAVERGRVAPAAFAKTTRSLAREWYLKKALAKKIARGMGLAA